MLANINNVLFGTQIVEIFIRTNNLESKVNVLLLQERVQRVTGHCIYTPLNIDQQG